jgi:hypothetical protein
VDSKKLPASLQTAYGLFIRDLAPWDYWATLTFSEDVPLDSALAALKRWLRIVAKEMVNAHVPCAWAVETQKRGTWHLHILLAFPGSYHLFDIRRADRLWQALHPLAGFTDFDEYDEEKGAPFYMAKVSEPDFNIACPRHPRCRRKGGCVEAPGAW